MAIGVNNVEFLSHFWHTRVIMSSKLKIIFYIVVTVILLGSFFVLGVYFGYQNRPEVDKVTSLFGKESEVVAQTDFAPFWKVWNLIDEKYPGADQISDQDRVWGSIIGLVESLEDPYSVFFPPGEAQMFEENIDGEFGGVGIEIGMRNDILTVIAPLKDTPAYKAGIKSGDKIIKIDETITADISIDKAVQLIRGEEGTKVKLTVVREEEEEPLEISIVRGIIKIPTIETELLPENVFVIRLFNFSANSPTLFRDALQEFINAKTPKLLIDLRGNPGGFLEAAIDMASWFLPSGDPVVIESTGEKEEEKVYRSKGYDIFTEELKLVILIDGGSASASEILAGALKEHGKATLVGTKTFGKGSVQELVDVTKDTALKITIAEWLTPNGISISEDGLVPDVEVEITKEDIEAERDPQMDKAIEILK